MLRLVFAGVSPTYSITLPPARGYVIAEDELRTFPDGSLAARFNGSTWVVHGQYYTQFEVEGGVRLRFENEGSSFDAGDLPSIVVSSGAIWGAGKLLALRTPDRQWRCWTQAVWPRVVLRKAHAH